MTWNGQGLPPELRDPPAGRYVVEAIEDEAPALSLDEEAGIEAALESHRAVITELAEMGVADHVLESISGHLSRRMLEHHSDIRIDAKRQALDALDNLRRGGDGGNGNGEPANDAEIETIVEVADDLTSQFGFAGLAALR